MPSFKNTVFAAATLLATAAQADYVIDPKSVSLSLRTSWCQSELSSCPLICQQSTDGQPTVNSCDPEVLTYGCVCSDGKQPNISEYSLTLPYFTCTEWGNQCVTKCGQNNACSASCREDHPCGALKPTRVNATSTSTASGSKATSTDDGDVEYNGLGGGSDSSKGGNHDTSAATNLQASASFVGLFTVAAGLAFGFGALL